MSKMSKEEKKLKFTCKNKVEYHHSLELRKHFSEIRKGKPSYIRDDACKRKSQLSSHTRRAVLQYTRDGVFIQEFISLKEAGKVLNLNPSNINSCCRGRYKTYHNFIFKFK